MDSHSFKCILSTVIFCFCAMRRKQAKRTAFRRPFQGTGAVCKVLDGGTKGIHATTNNPFTNQDSRKHQQKQSDSKASLTLSPKPTNPKDEFESWPARGACSTFIPKRGSGAVPLGAPLAGVPKMFPPTFTIASRWPLWPQTIFPQSGNIEGKELLLRPGRKTRLPERRLGNMSLLVCPTFPSGVLLSYSEPPRVQKFKGQQRPKEIGRHSNESSSLFLSQTCVSVLDLGAGKTQSPPPSHPHSQLRASLAH